MSKLNYSINTSITANQGRVGEAVTLTASFDNVEGDIKKVYLSVPRYYIREPFSKTEDNQYELRYRIPYDAPRGQYNVEVYAIDENWEPGPKSRLEFTVA